MSTNVITLDLGKGNIGGLGPNGLSADDQAEFRKVYPESRLEGLTNLYVCMDGRFEAGPNGQVLGGIAILDTYTSLMTRVHNTDHPSEKISNIVAAKTKQAIADDLTVTVHGDGQKHEEGCAANAAMETVLRFQAAEIDTIAPLTWNIGRRLGLDKFLEPEELTRLILNGKANADNEALWDVDAAGRARIIVENGGTYVELPGAHNEVDAVFDLDEDESIDRAKFGGMFTTENGKSAQLFMVTLGKYAKDTFERVAKHGGTEKDAAKQVLSAISLHIAAFKILGAEDMGASLVGKPYKPADK